MSTSYSPKIVTNGLTLVLDAANRRSYPGSGTSWNDLSGNTKDGTLTNGPTFDSANGGSIVLDRVNDYIPISNTYTSPSLPTGTSPRTLICCFKTPNNFSGAPYEHILHYGSPSTDQAYGIALFNNGGNYYISNHTWSGTSYDSSRIIQSNTIYYVTVTYNDSSTPRNTFFINDTFGTVAYGQGKIVDYSINTGTGTELRIGARISTPLEYFGGNIYFVMVYNRVLSAQEILQNFNATRSRFGV